MGGGRDVQRRWGEICVENQIGQFQTSGEREMRGCCGGDSGRVEKLETRPEQKSVEREKVRSERKSLVVVVVEMKGWLNMDIGILALRRICFWRRRRRRWS